MKNFKTLYLIAVILMLFAACFNQPYGYYNFLRAIVSVTCGLLIYWHWEDSVLLKVFFFMVIVLYNPFEPVELLDKQLWIKANVVLIGLFLERAAKFFQGEN